MCVSGVLALRSADKEALRGLHVWEPWPKGARVWCQRDWDGAPRRLPCCFQGNRQTMFSPHFHCVVHQSQACHSCSCSRLLRPLCMCQSGKRSSPSACTLNSINTSLRLPVNHFIFILLCLCSFTHVPLRFWSVPSSCCLRHVTLARWSSLCSVSVWRFWMAGQACRIWPSPRSTGAAARTDLELASLRWNSPGVCVYVWSQYRRSQECGLDKCLLVGSVCVCVCVQQRTGWWVRACCQLQLQYPAWIQLVLPHCVHCLAALACTVPECC